MAMEGLQAVRISENDGLVAVQENPVLGVPAYRAAQDRSLDLASDRDHFVGRGRVADAADVLLDDRTFVEVGGDEVGGRADDLHAPRMGLVIGLGALETRQEAVVDVDAAAGQLGREVVREDLHVAGQHSQIGAGLLNQRPELRLLRNNYLSMHTRGRIHLLVA